MTSSITGIPGHCPDGASLLAAAEAGGETGRDSVARLCAGPVRGRGKGVIEGADAAKNLIERLLGGSLTAEQFDTEATAACAGADRGYLGAFTGTVTGVLMSLSAPRL